MRKFLTVFILLFFVLHTSWAVAESVDACCWNGDCPVTQCASAGCLPASMPAAGARIFTIHTNQLVQYVAAEDDALLPEPVQEVWGPPD